MAINVSFILNKKWPEWNSEVLRRNSDKYLSDCVYSVNLSDRGVASKFLFSDEVRISIKYIVLNLKIYESTIKCSGWELSLLFYFYMCFKWHTWLISIIRLVFAIFYCRGYDLSVKVDKSPLRTFVTRCFNKP